MKYRKKPVVIEAQQFTDELKYRVYLWAQSIQMNVYHSFDDAGKPILKIPTLEGEMICSLGDYLILEPFPTDWRKIYPCKPDIFEKTYEPVADETPAVITASDLARAEEKGRREGRFEAARIVSAKAADAGRRGYIITAGDGTAKQLDDYLYNIHDALLAEGKEK